MKFCIKIEEGLYYASSENKGTDQLCSYCTELHSCSEAFSHGQRYGSLMTWLIFLKCISMHTEENVVYSVFDTMINCHFVSQIVSEINYKFMRL